jgi:hypothetical protein
VAADNVENILHNDLPRSNWGTTSGLCVTRLEIS